MGNLVEQHLDEAQLLGGGGDLVILQFHEVPMSLLEFDAMLQVCSFMETSCCLLELTLTVLDNCTCRIDQYFHKQYLSPKCTFTEVLLGKFAFVFMD